MKKTENGVTIHYVNRYYEKNLSTGAVTLYYYLGGRMVGYKTGTDVRYVYKDHLTGTSTTADSAGNAIGGARYAAYGDIRSSWGVLPSHKFTGQRLDDVGLYYYSGKYTSLSFTGVPDLRVTAGPGGRYYDPGLARFIQADSMVPALANPQHLNRYSYVLDNPLKYVDQQGNFPVLAVLAGAVIGAGVNVAVYTVTDWGNTTGSGFASAALTGAISGGVGVVAGPVGGTAAKAMGQTATSVTAKIGTMAVNAMTGAATNALDQATETGKVEVNWQMGANALTSVVAGKIGDVAAPTKNMTTLNSIEISK